MAAENFRAKCSFNLRSFVENLHTAIVGKNRGEILSLTDQNARSTSGAILELSRENPDRVMHEIRQIVQPSSSVIVSRQMDLFSPKEPAQDFSIRHKT